MYQFDKYKTEVIGISSEIAIAKVFNLNINEHYVLRGDTEIVNLLTNIIQDVFNQYSIPTPIQHVAENQNSVDFILLNNKTLSVKSNKKDLGKIAPQVVGQPTSDTYFKDLFPENIPDDYIEKVKLFKIISIEKINLIIEKYWDYLFHCDYLIIFYNILNKQGFINSKPEVIVLSKLKHPIWIKEKFSFTQNIDSWNESNTVKYDGLAIGEFQVHNNRDCFKFRFNLKNIIKLIDENRL